MSVKYKKLKYLTAKFTRVYLVPTRTSEVICQYQPDLLVSCILPGGKRKVIDRYGAKPYILNIPPVVWCQKFNRTINELTRKLNDIYLYKFVKKDEKSIFVETYMPFVNGRNEVCWGHEADKPDPVTIKEADIRYWASGHGQHSAYGSYNGKGNDFSGTILGTNHISYTEKMDALLVSTDPEIVEKFPASLSVSNGQNPVLIQPLYQRCDGCWLAKVEGKAVLLGELGKIQNFRQEKKVKAKA